MPKADQSDRILLVGGDTAIGVAVVRSLGRKGVEIHAAQRLAEGLSRYSRYCRGLLWLAADPRAQYREISRYLAEKRITHLMATSENYISLLNHHRAELESKVRVLFPPADVFDRALYKDRTYEFAAQCGISVPRTVQVNSLDELGACAGLSFPVILKPRHRDATEGVQTVFALKAERVDSFERLATALRPYAEGGEFPLVQEYVAGHGVGVSLIMRGGSPVCALQHHRIRELPPSGGVSVFCESVELDESLFEKSVALLRAMDWEGVAMVEYRHDPERGETYLMEVNGRFWGSLPLALHSDADFPYLLYQSGFAPVPFRAARAGVRARSLAGDTKWLWLVLRHGPPGRLAAICQYLLGFSLRVRYFTFAIDDPLPAVMNFVHRFLPARRPGGAE